MCTTPSHRRRRGRPLARLAAGCLLQATLHAAAADGDGADAAMAVRDAAVPAPGPPRQADFGGAPASPDARHVANWVLHSGDSAGMPYLVVDKVAARVFLFDRHGRLQGDAPALLGMERGDGTAAGVGNRTLAAIPPAERTTPAGRFVASLAPDLKGEAILWVDYDSALALHRVARGTAAERRAERLQSATPADNRISYGCINVPVAFFESVVSPAFAASSGVVYILPETRPAHEVFGSRDVAMPAGVAGD